MYLVHPLKASQNSNNFQCLRGCTKYQGEEGPIYPFLGCLQIKEFCPILPFLGQKWTKFGNFRNFEINHRSIYIYTTRIWNLGGKCLWWPKLHGKVTIFFKCKQFWNRWIIWDSKNGFGFIWIDINYVLSGITLCCCEISKNERFQIKEWYCSFV